MPLYYCKYCYFSSKIKTHYTRHLETKKHKNNYTKSYHNEKKSIKSPYNSLQNPPILEGKSIISLQNPPILEGKKYIFNKEIYKCEYCNKEFSRQDNLKRHIDKRCSKNKNNNFKDFFSIINDTHEKEKKELKKQIEVLLDKVGDTNNTTINNTIILNNYGSEDLSHITDALKTQLLKIPYGMIPKMIEEVHFNNDKPENKNIMLTNSRDNKLKIFKNNKWIYKDKTEALNDLVDNKYFILDTYYDTVQEENNNDNDLNTYQTEKYKKFRELIDNGDKSLIENIKKECELLLLNNR
jgi:hypothetical protein